MEKKKVKNYSGLKNYVWNLRKNYLVAFSVNKLYDLKDILVTVLCLFHSNKNCLELTLNDDV